MKKVAPIIITLLLITYALLYLLVPIAVFKGDEPLLAKAFVLIIPAFALAFMGALIYTLFIRLKEIDREDKDDLSQY